MSDYAYSLSLSSLLSKETCRIEIDPAPLRAPETYKTNLSLPARAKLDCPPFDLLRN